MKSIKHIGELNGTVLLFGGVYSNLQALESLMGIAEKAEIPPSNIICTGDIVAYCADPEACVQTIMDWGVYCIAGNVEIQLREGLDDCGCAFDADSRCDLFAKQWYPYAQKRVSPKSIQWMDTLPEFLSFDFEGRRATVVHGSYHRTSAFVFESTPWETKQASFDDTNSDIIVASHCGLPFHHVQNDKYWLNPGVIGMPANDSTTRVWYMLLQPGGEQLQFQHHSFEFDHEETFARMLENELPISYAQTLTSGRWDNNDILPQAEREIEGIPYQF